jgi:hypothetical protein
MTTEKTAEQKIADGELVTGNFTIQAQMPLGKSITVSGYIYAHNTRHEVNKQLDFLHDVVDRQRLRSEIPELEVKLDQRFVQLRQLKEALADLQRKSEVKKLTAAQQNQLDQLFTNVKVVDEDINKGQAALADAKKKLLEG